MSRLKLGIVVFSLISLTSLWYYFQNQEEQPSFSKSPPPIIRSRILVETPATPVAAPVVKQPAVKQQSRAAQVRQPKQKISKRIERETSPVGVGEEKMLAEKPKSQDIAKSRVVYSADNLASRSKSPAETCDTLGTCERSTDSISLVGVVAKTSAPGRDKVRLNGDMKRGHYQQKTPAIYLD